MEVISKYDILHEIRGAKESNEMRFTIAGHKIHLLYSHYGKEIVCRLDGERIQDCDLTILYHLLDDWTNARRIKIKLSNEPQSGNWKKIRIDGDEMNCRIREKVMELGIERRYKGFDYLCEAIYMVCQLHMAGRLVDIIKIVDRLAEKHEIKRVSMEYSMRIAVESHPLDRTEWQREEIRKYHSRACAGARDVILNLSHSLLDEWYQMGKKGPGSGNERRRPLT
ncbi:MAG: hypothetical protein HFJ80_05085 [Clostridiales bacterium]|nr:hypothetical protein [Clostridiales bacterium]